MSASGLDFYPDLLVLVLDKPRLFPVASLGPIYLVLARIWSLFLHLYTTLSLESWPPRIREIQTPKSGIECRSPA